MLRKREDTHIITCIRVCGTQIACRVDGTAVKTKEGTRVARCERVDIAFSKI